MPGHARPCDSYMPPVPSIIRFAFTGPKTAEQFPRLRRSSVSLVLHYHARAVRSQVAEEKGWENDK